MVKSIGTNWNNAANETTNVEPSIRIHLDIGAGIWAGSREFENDGLTDQWDARIEDFGGLTNATKTKFTSTIESVSFALDDYDGLIRVLLDSGAGVVPVTIWIVYQGEAGTNEKIFEGIINDYEWDEGQRICTFTAEAQSVNSGQIGYIIAEDQLGANNDPAIGKVWPIVFGKVHLSPAIHVQEIPRTTLSDPFYFAGTDAAEEIYDIVDGSIDGTPIKDIVFNDAMLPQSIHTENGSTSIVKDKFFVEDSTGFSSGVIDVIIDGVIFRGEFNGNTFNIQEANAPKYENISFAARQQDEDENNPYVAWVSDTSLNLINTVVSFKEGDIPAVFFYWSDDKEFNLRVVRQEGTKIWFEETIVREHLIDQNDTATYVKGLSKSGLKDARLVEVIKRMKKFLGRRAARREYNINTPFRSLLEELELLKYVREAFWSAREGQEVREWNGSKKDIYVANSVESNDVYGVVGIKDGALAPIPKSLYTIVKDKSANLTDGPQIVTTIEFDEPLDTLKNQGWADEVYVSLDSTLSENPADVLKTILESETNLTVDSSTYTAVKGKVGNYPCNFTLTQQWDAVSLAEIIAWQSRIGLIYEGTTVKMKYLSEEPSADYTFTKDNIEFSTFRIAREDLSNIVTSMSGNWQPNIAPETENNRKKNPLIYENNTATFGTVKDSREFFAFNMQSLVQKSLNFWGYRASNIWKIARFTAFHDAGRLEPFDAVNINLNDSGILANVKGIVLSVDNRITDGRVDFVVWLPVQDGDNQEDSNVWLDDSGDSTPSNPADNAKEVDYGVYFSNDEVTLDDVIKSVRKFTENR